MAENEDRNTEDLTEEASPHRLEEYRDRGQVAQSREVSALLALLAAGTTAYILSPKMGQQIGGFMVDVFRADLSAKGDFLTGPGAHTLFVKAVMLMASLGLPICLAGFVMGIIGSFVQVGPLFTVEPVTPNLEKLDPISGFRRIFSGRQLIEGVRLIFKLAVLSLVAYGLVKTQVFRSSAFMGIDPADVMPAFGSAAKAIFVGIFGVLALFAAIDYGLQRWEMSKQLRMTKQEVKQEHKEREGDPMIKARIRAIQREISRRRMMQAVKKATVVVTNPTHIAIALYYDKDTMSAPRVVAKGADFLAQRIKKIAAEAGVPMVENVPLARTLYKTVKLNQAVPRALYQAIAEVLAYVYRLRNPRGH